MLMITFLYFLQQKLMHADAQAGFQALADPPSLSLLPHPLLACLESVESLRVSVGSEAV